jgi:hypothetical protein
MPLELHHIGEELVANLLNRLHEKRRLSNVECRECKKTLEQMLAAAGTYEESRSNMPFDVTLANGKKVGVDAMHEIDVAVYGNERVFPAEVKLGKGQLGIGSVCASITDACELRNDGQYLKGPMWSLLARTGAATGATIEVQENRRPVTEEWALVIRRSVYATWAKNRAKKTLHSACPNAHVLVFEDLVTEISMAATPFAEVIEDVVRFDAGEFAEKWYTAE